MSDYAYRVTLATGISTLKLVGHTAVAADAMSQWDFGKHCFSIMVKREDGALWESCCK
jgi:hypothetical protein